MADAVIYQIRDGRKFLGQTDDLVEISAVDDGHVVNDAIPQNGNGVVLAESAAGRRSRQEHAVTSVHLQKAHGGVAVDVPMKTAHDDDDDHALLRISSRDLDRYD